MQEEEEEVKVGTRCLPMLWPHASFESYNNGGVSHGYGSQL